MCHFYVYSLNISVITLGVVLGWIERNWAIQGNLGYFKE